MSSWGAAFGASTRDVVTRLGLLVALIAVPLGAASCAESNASESTAPGGQLASATPSAAIACGRTGLPDCPLQAWMKATLQPYLTAKDATRLATSLDQLAEKAPPGFGDWQESALAGAKAARSGDLAGAKAQCKHCHDQHRSRFRAERRAVALF